MTAHTIRNAKQVTRNKKRVLPVTSHMSRVTIKGFTLIELLVVIGILAVLLAITLIAINPARQFQQANDTKRAADVNAILNAVHQFAADNAGQLPTGIATTSQYISSAEVGTQFCADIVPQYIAALPSDPTFAQGTNVTTCASTFDTGYEIIQGGNNRVTITAPYTEIQTPDISVTR